MGASGVCHSDLSVPERHADPARSRSCSATRARARSSRSATVSTASRWATTSSSRGSRSAGSATAASTARATCARPARWRWPRAACSTAHPLLARDGEPVNQMACSGTFSEQTIVPAISVVKIPDDVPFDGRRAHRLRRAHRRRRRAQHRRHPQGDTVAVIGCGGVGLNVIQGAKIAGAGEIIAIDMLETQARHGQGSSAPPTLVNAGDGDPVDQGRGAHRRPRRRRRVRGHRARGDDRAGHQMTRRGGEVMLVGVPRLDVFLEPERRVHVPAHGQDDQGLLVRVVERQRGRARS